MAKTRTALPAHQYRVAATTTPAVGVIVEITVTPGPGQEETLPAFWLPAEAASQLIAAMNSQLEKARSMN